MSIEHDLIMHMFRGDLKTAQSMADIGDYQMALHSLQRAQEKLNQLSSLINTSLQGGDSSGPANPKTVSTVSPTIDV